MAGGQLIQRATHRRDHFLESQGQERIVEEMKIEQAYSFDGGSNGDVYQGP